MQRDYAKGSHKNRTQGTPIQHDWFSPEVTMAIFFVTLLVVAASVLGYHYHRDSLQIANKTTDHRSLEQAPNFEFYQMLPNTSLSEPAKQATPSPVNKLNKAGMQAGYLIQAGSFRTQQQAVELVKSLQAIQLQAYWQTTPIPNQGTWYRVYIGPFSNADIARNTQLTLDAQLVPESFVIHTKMKGTV